MCTQSASRARSERNVKNISTSWAFGGNLVRDQSIAKWNSLERMLLAVGAPYKRFGRRQDAMTSLVKCSDETVHFPLYFPTLQRSNVTTPWTRCGKATLCDRAFTDKMKGSNSSEQFAKHLGLTLKIIRFYMTILTCVTMPKANLINKTICTQTVMSISLLESFFLKAHFYTLTQ